MTAADVARARALLAEVDLEYGSPLGRRLLHQAMQLLDEPDVLSDVERDVDEAARDVDASLRRFDDPHPPGE